MSIIVGLLTADATCLEGALKIKEVSYMHSEGVSLVCTSLIVDPRGRTQARTPCPRRRAPPVSLALFFAHFRVIFIMTKDSLYPKVQSALAQVTARKGRPSELTSEPR